MNCFVSRSGRSFYKATINDRSIWIHNRKKQKNITDIAYCAALAFHKSIIGISELLFLESATQKRYRSSVAVQTYYIVYHLFCCCMLLDPNYEIKKAFSRKDDFEKGNIVYEADIDVLNSSDESAKTWNACKINEMDMATNITHSEIKQYCKTLRQDRKRLEDHLFLNVIYSSFISEKCGTNNNKMLFERLDYIRDRSIYRPSVVVESTPPFKFAQTSNEVRKEIDSLPTSEELYCIIQKVFAKIIGEKNNELIEAFILAFSLEGYVVDCKEDHLRDVGYKWDDAEKIGGNKSFEYVPSFAYQLMELFEPQDAILVFEKYWSPLYSQLSRNEGTDE